MPLDSSILSKVQGPMGAVQAAVRSSVLQFLEHTANLVDGYGSMSLVLESSLRHGLLRILHTRGEHR